MFWFFAGAYLLVMVWGGESQSKAFFNVGCSIKARCIGKLACLEPNSSSLQKPVEGYLTQRFGALYKGAIVSSEHNSTPKLDKHCCLAQKNLKRDLNKTATTTVRTCITAH